MTLLLAPGGSPEDDVAAGRPTDPGPAPELPTTWTVVGR